MARTPRNLCGGQRCRLRSFPILSGVCQSACWSAKIRLYAYPTKPQRKSDTAGKKQHAPSYPGEGCLSWDPSPLFQPCLTGNAGAHVLHDAETCTLSTIPSSTLFPFPHAPPAHSSPCVYTSPRCVLTSAAACPTKPSPAFLKNFSRLRSPKYNAILTNSGHISDVMPN